MALGFLPQELVKGNLELDMDLVPGLNLDPLNDPRNNHMLGFHIRLGVAVHPGKHGYVVCEAETKTVLETWLIQQNEDGIDMEDRIVVLKRKITCLKVSVMLYRRMRNVN